MVFNMKLKKNKSKFLSILLFLLIFFGTGVSLAPSPVLYVNNEQDSSINDEKAPSIDDEQEFSVNTAQVDNPWNLPEWLLAAAYLFPLEDYDEDGASNGVELWLGTNPYDEDSDNDDMWDGYEIYCGWIQGGWQDPLVSNDRYAVLLVGARGDSSGNIDIASNMPQYWNELVRIYDTLVDGYNYKPENIFVFYADGDFPNENNSPSNLIERGYILKNSIETHQDMELRPATRLSLFLSLVTLKNIMDSDDSLFFWVYDHGVPTKAPESSISLWNCELLTDSELTSWLSDFDFAQATFVLGQCYSGGFLDKSIVEDNGGYMHPEDKDEYDNLNDLAPDGEKNVIVMTTADFKAGITGFDSGFLHSFRRYITPYWIILSEDRLITIGTGEYAMGVEWRLGIYDISWEALMKFNARYLRSRSSSIAVSDPDDVVSIKEAYFLTYYDNLQSGVQYSPQYWESVDGLGQKTYL